MSPRQSVADLNIAIQGALLKRHSVTESQDESYQSEDHRTCVRTRFGRTQASYLAGESGLVPCTPRLEPADYYDEAIKPVAIHLLMGRRQVGACGNSDNNVPMLFYLSANPAYKTFGLLVHYTDAAR